MRRSPCVCVLIGLTFLFLFEIQTCAVINPNFTPLHLTNASTWIAVLNPKVKGDLKGTITLSATQTLKGDETKDVSIDMSKGAVDHRENALEALAKAKDSKGVVIIFSGTDENNKPAGFVSVDGLWLELTPADNSKWDFVKISKDMLGTWNGGSDMLLRCVCYILASPEHALVPSEADMAWRSYAKIGQVNGTTKALGAPNVKGDGTPFLYVASPEGDMLLKGTKGKESVLDVTASLKLNSKSQASAWGYFSGSGRLDLLSFDGQKLVLHAQGSDGMFAPVEVKVDVPKGLLNMLTIGTDSPGKLGVALVTEQGLKILRDDGKGAFAIGCEIDIPLSTLKTLGKPSKAVVADFNGDGFADILQPFEKDGLLYAGKKAGAFGEPSACGVATGEGTSVASIGDFDADGVLDVLLAGSSGVQLYQNQGIGKFVEVLQGCGEVSYKAPPLATWCDVGDFNDDGRADFILSYSDQMPIFYFNRGFRSFGLAVNLYTSVQNESNSNAVAGQKAGILADLDADGALDVVQIMTDGEIWCYYNSNSENKPVSVTVKAPLSCGPVSLTCKTSVRSLGAQSAQAGSRDAVFGIGNETGLVRISWQIPGQMLKTKEIKVGQKSVVVDLDKEK